MTADPPPIMIDDNVPVIDVRMFKFCLTISHTESNTSSRVPIFVRIKLMTPCWATENSSVHMYECFFIEVLGLTVSIELKLNFYLHFEPIRQWIR